MVLVANLGLETVRTASELVLQLASSCLLLWLLRLAGIDFLLIHLLGCYDLQVPSLLDAAL